MRTGTNIAVQLAALLAFAALRLAVPGWMLLIFIVTAVGPVLVLVPAVLAVGTARRGRLGGYVTAPFLTAASTLVLAGALVPDLDDQRSYTPVIAVFARSAPHGGGLADAVGYLAALANACAAIWTVVAVLVSSRRRRAVPAP